MVDRDDARRESKPLHVQPQQAQQFYPPPGGGEDDGENSSDGEPLDQRLLATAKNPPAIRLPSGLNRVSPSTQRKGTNNNAAIAFAGR